MTTSQQRNQHVALFWHPASSKPPEELKYWNDHADANIRVVAETDADKILRDAGTLHREGRLAAFIAKAGTPPSTASGVELLQAVLKLSNQSVFTILYSFTASHDAKWRLAAMNTDKIHMVSHRQDEVAVALMRVSCYPVLPERAKEPEKYPYTCPMCALPHLDQQSLWLHMPLFHVGEKKTRRTLQCPICRQTDKTMVVHIHDEHAPANHPVDQSRSGVVLYSFGLVVVRRKKDNKFLVVQEYGSQGYWLPGGGIDANEMPTTAALRECVEEVGVKVKLTGLLRVEVAPSGRHCRMRYIFYGEPVDELDCEPKTLPDFESAGACWVTADEIRSGSLQLRGPEPLEWFDYVDRGGTIHDVDLLTEEGAPPPTLAPR